MSRELHRWSKNLIKEIDKSFNQLTKRQDVFNEAFIKFLSDDEKFILSEKLDALNNKVIPSDEDLKEIMKKITKDTQDD